MAAASGHNPILRWVLLQPQNLCSYSTDRRGEIIQAAFLKLSEHLCSRGFQDSCPSIQSAAAVLPLRVLASLLSKPKQIYSTPQIDLWERAFTTLPLLSFHPWMLQSTCIQKKSTATVIKTSLFKRSLEYWKLLYSPRRWVKPGKAVLGVFSSVTRYSRALHDAEYKWGSSWDFNPYLVLLFDKPELKVIS